MSTKLVEIKKEIARFLKSSEPEVLCIRGKWGVGKTYGWKALLKEPKDHGGIELESYAYVSLFGLDSLDQLKYAVFENSVSVNDIGIEPSVETLRSNTTSVVNRLGRKGAWILGALPGAKNYAAALQSLAFLSVQKRSYASTISNERDRTYQ